MLRLGLSRLKVKVQSAVHPCVGKHWSTMQNCGRLHNFGGLKPQNNQTLISTVAHYYKTGQGKTTEQYVGDKPKHGTLQHPIYHSDLQQHPALCFHCFSCWHDYQKQDYLSSIKYDILTACGLCNHTILRLLIWSKTWLVHCIFPSVVMQHLSTCWAADLNHTFHHFSNLSKVSHSRLFRRLALLNWPSTNDSPVIA